MRKIGLIICAVVLLYIFISVAFRADINSELKISSKDKQTNLASIKSKLIDPNVPDSWYQETKSASEMGIKNFTQSPLLDARVKSGKLPPVNERLVDPIVIEPYKSIGKYGGTLETYSLDLGRPELRGYMGGFKLTMLRTDAKTIVPWLLKKYEYKDDYREIILTFRKGLKWSDGVDFIPAVEYRFWFDHIVGDKRVTSRGPLDHPPGIKSIDVIDPYTVKLNFNSKDPNYHSMIIIHSATSLKNNQCDIQPSHYIKKIHPGFIGMEAAKKIAKEKGFESVEIMFIAILKEASKPLFARFAVPTMLPYIVSKRTQTEILYERNPYYPFVDTEGNQLPYIDYVRTNLASSVQIAELKASTGEADIAYSMLSASNVPFYKKMEKKGGYKTLIWVNSSSSFPFYMFNFNNTANPQYIPIFMDKRFRQAMSLAINRKKVNKRFFFGKGIPMQATFPVTHPLFKEAYAKSFADYDPERAKKLLDEMGMKDTNGDGFREMPDGSPFSIKLMWADSIYFGQIELNELIVEYWQDIGIKIGIDVVGSSSFWQRSFNSDYDIKGHNMDGVMPSYSTGAIVRGLSPIMGGPASGWTQWGSWFLTNGKVGVEPPEDIKKLQALGMKAKEGNMQALDELGKQLAENLWVIGTVGHTPVPIIINNRLKNVVKTGVWGHSSYEKFMLPEQWYIDDENTK